MDRLGVHAEGVMQMEREGFEQMSRRIPSTENPLGLPHADLTSARTAASSPEADTLREEILAVGRKLWQREYVDGNGGNISVRLGTKYILCTPTMLSKADLQPSDLCLCDLDGNVLVGGRTRTSELLLHLQIYRSNSHARAIVHCHPPHATAFAITGSAPPNGLTPEYEFLIGPAAVAPYETPGTQAFAETVLPFVHDHNTILLRNHGVVCWAESVTRAEWQVEVLDTYCKTFLIAQQIGSPLNFISGEKLQEILEIKRRMGLPDPRLKIQPICTSDPSPELEQVARKILAHERM